MEELSLPQPNGTSTRQSDDLIVEVEPGMSGATLIRKLAGGLRFDLDGLVLVGIERAGDGWWWRFRSTRPPRTGPLPWEEQA